jgi:cobalamin biosynthesis protein CobT
MSRRRSKRDKNSSLSKKMSTKHPPSAVEPVEIGSREYWQSVSFPVKVRAQHTAGYQFLQGLLRKETSFNHFEGSTQELVTILKDLIKLYNSLKIGKSISVQGNRSTLCGKIDLNIPGMDPLLREADSAIENPKRMVDKDDSSSEEEEDSEDSSTETGPSNCGASDNKSVHNDDSSSEDKSSDDSSTTSGQSDSGASDNGPNDGIGQGCTAPLQSGLISPSP